MCNYYLFLQGCDEEEKVKIEKQIKEVGVSSLKCTHTESALQGHNDKSNAPTEENLEHLDAAGSVPSVSSSVSTAAMSPSTHKELRGSPASSCEGAGAPSAAGLNSSHGRLSSCSTVKITEDQLMLNPVKSEVGRGGKNTQHFGLWTVNKSMACLIHPQPRQAQEEVPGENQEAATLHQAPLAESQRQGVEKKRRVEQEAERRQREERMRNELEEERRKKAENLRSESVLCEEQKPVNHHGTVHLKACMEQTTQSLFDCILVWQSCRKYSNLMA